MTSNEAKRELARIRNECLSQPYNHERRLIARLAVIMGEFLPPDEDDEERRHNEIMEKILDDY